jgi:hypothetical protein
VLLGQFCEGHNVVAVAASCVVEFSTAGDESQLTLICGAVDLGGGEAILRVSLDTFDDKCSDYVIRGLDPDRLTRDEFIETEEHSGAEMAVDMANNH